jgi:hypothetical protein
MFKSVLSFAFQAEKDYLYREGQNDSVYDMYAPVVIQDNTL